MVKISTESGSTNMKTVLITGANGLCGNAIRRLALKYLYKFIYITHQDADLTKEDVVLDIYNDYKPNYVIHTAAKVGGIGGNEAGHGDFFHDNILINTHMIHYAKEFNVEKMIAFSSVCVFPDDLAKLQEDRMHDGPVYASNFAYGYAKRMVDIQIQAYKQQFGITNYCSVIPGNIWGPNDLYNIKTGHVIPSLIHKLFLAEQDDTDFIVWGDGKSLREFIYVDDLAKIVLDMLSFDKLPERLIVSGPIQYSIREIVEKLLDISGFSGILKYDTSKPNGQRSRPSDLSLFYSYFPNFSFTNIDKGLKESYKWFCNNYPNIRL